MVENTRLFNTVNNIILILGILFIATPLWFVISIATNSYESVLQNGISAIPGTSLFDNLKLVFTETLIPQQLFNSFKLALLMGIGKCFFAYITAFALVFYQPRYGNFIFALILITMMLPLDVRVVTTYQVIANILSPINWIFEALNIPLAKPLNLSLIDNYLGICLPLISSGTGTFMLRQFFKTIPKELSEAVKMDGGNAWHFARDILLPLSKTNIIAIFVLMFIGGWSSYLWPLVATSQPDMQPAVVGITRLRGAGDGEIDNFPMIMSAVLLVSIIPILIIGLSQKYIAKGLTLTDK